MEKIKYDLSSTDYLENEKFDFDLASSPNINQDQINEHQDAEVFFGPVGFTEQCVATRAKTLQQENDIKPLSPLTGKQVVEIFKEANKVALQIEKLSSNHSPLSSLSSNSSSILQLSNISLESPNWLTGHLSSGSSEGTCFTQFELDFDKENIQPLAMNNNLNSDINKQIPCANERKQGAPAMKEENIISLAHDTDGKYNEEMVQKSDDFKDNAKLYFVEKNGQEKIEISGGESGQMNGEKVAKKEENVQQKLQDGIESNKIPVVKPRGSGLPVRPGLKTSRLPKTKNMGKSMSAFSSPIRSIGSGKKRDVPVKNAVVVEKASCKVDTNSSNSKLRKSTPSRAPQDASKMNPKPEKTLVKRKIFNSSEAPDKLGTKDCKPKLPVSGSHISAPRSRRRRSSSLSSLDSSQSSASSHTSQDDTVTSKLVRPSTKIPTTKGSLATRRCKLQDTTADKKPQPLKALPRPGFASSKKIDCKTDTKAAKAMPPPSTEQDSKGDKTPAMPATPSSLPVARRRSSFKSSLSSTSSRESSPPKYFTPRKAVGRITEPKTTSTCKRRSSNPTPRSNAPPSASRRVLKSSGDESVLLPLSPATKPKSTRTNRKLIPDNDPSSFNGPVFSTQTVDDLLGCDNDDGTLQDVVPIQPRPIVAQAVLVDLSDL